MVDIITMAMAKAAASGGSGGDMHITGNLQVDGNITQQGQSYETHAQKVYTKDDYIITRDGAVSGLSSGDYSGFQVKKYDGTNDGRLVVDSDGTARVGDIGDEQPLLTRAEAADLVNGAPLVWDSTNLKAISGASSGGWTLRTANNDWTDMFNVENTTITAKKNIIMWDSTNNNQIFIIKGESRAYKIVKETICTSFAGGNEFYFAAHYEIGTSQIQDAEPNNVTCNYRGYKYDNANNAFSGVTSNNFSKKNIFTIYTKD